jgi:hypothetical protein
MVEPPEFNLNEGDLIMLKKLFGAAKSNTVQFNGVVALLWFLDVLGDTSIIADNPEYTSVLGGVMALVNILLRFKTKKPLEER